ncbi:hypothetical protein TWF102_006967 [Orbilia oligospora]|uniref:Uncharacterized protein n=1 Tax=Orbilia oligospora TaxID=2813651 RepID=A0A7C8NGH7_ORBOL|nr:hypothetical protein TWF103_005840 [Orbilia oligospora]KAF3111294.1 hypothetical protein TWF102_006967 [Orbilia oligospora]
MTEICTLERYRDSITSDARSNLQHIFHYGFKYDIHDRHASLAHYHTEVSYVVSAIPMHQDIVTTQWETREGPKTTDEPLNTAGVLWRTGHRLELLTLGTQLFNIGNALSKKNNFYSALFNYRGALEVIRRAQMMFYWEKASLERFLPYLEAVIRSNIIVCCAKQAGTSRNITPSAMQFYQAEMESDRLQSKHMTWGIGSAVWLMAILQIFTRQSSASVTKKLELFIRHMPNDEKMGVARSLIELVKSQSLQDQVMKPSLTNMLLRSLDDFTYPDILLGQPEFKWGLDFAQYSGEFYLLESLDPTEAKRYRQILQLGGIWEEICGTKIKTAQYDKLLGKYTTFIQGKKNHGGETGCVCKPTIIVSFHEIRVGVVCKTGLCMGLTGLAVKTTDSDTEKREAPLYGLEVRFENFFSIESEEERPRAVSTPKV